MANEEKKDFNVMLHDAKDMPKIQILTDEASIRKYGGNKMFFAPPPTTKSCGLSRPAAC